MLEAKSNLSRLVAAIETGEVEEVQIARAGHVVARLVAPAPTALRRPGGMKGRISISEDFDAPLPKDIDDDFAGNHS